MYNVGFSLLEATITLPSLSSQRRPFHLWAQHEGKRSAASEICV